jgi:hypothetical protein
VPSNSKANLVGQSSVSVSIQSDTTSTATQSTDTSTTTTTDTPDGGDSVVVVTVTTDVTTTVTATGPAPTQPSNATATTTTSDGVDTATAIVTATLTVSTALPTALPPITLAQIFPNCINSTANFAALANVTIPDMVLPSNLTLSQVLGFIGGQTDCSEVSQLLGIGNSTSSLKRRDLFHARRMFYNYVKGLKLR